MFSSKYFFFVSLIKCTSTPYFYVAVGNDTGFYFRTFLSVYITEDFD